MVESVPAGIADEYILVAVIVIVCDRNAKAEAEISTVETSLRGNILKSPIPLVAQQAVIVRSRCFIEFRQLGAVGQEQIHQAIVIEVDCSHATAHWLGKILSSREVIVRPVGEGREFGNICEPIGRSLGGGGNRASGKYPCDAGSHDGHRMKWR